MMRRLELSLQFQEHFPKILRWVHEQGKIEEFIKGLEYLRTFGGEDGKFLTYLALDTFEAPYSFIGYIQRTDPYGSVLRDEDGKSMIWLTIGMIWHRSSESWSFHT